MTGKFQMAILFNSSEISSIPVNTYFLQEDEFMSQTKFRLCAKGRTKTCPEENGENLSLTGKVQLNSRKRRSAKKAGKRQGIVFTLKIWPWGEALSNFGQWQIFLNVKVKWMNKYCVDFHPNNLIEFNNLYEKSY